MRDSHSVGRARARLLAGCVEEASPSFSTLTERGFQYFVTLTLHRTHAARTSNACLSAE